MRRFRMLPRLAALWVLATAGTAGAQNWTCGEEMAPMRDGVRLATDVYVPRGQGPGPFPVVLERTPYDKRSCAHRYAEYFAARGYVAMVAGRTGPLPLRRGVLLAARRGLGRAAGRLRQRRVGGGASGVEREGGHPRALLHLCEPAPHRPPPDRRISKPCSARKYAANSYRDVFWQGGALHMIMPTWLLTQREMVKPLRLNVPGPPGDISVRRIRGPGGTTNTWKRATVFPPACSRTCTTTWSATLTTTTSGGRSRWTSTTRSSMCRSITSAVGTTATSTAPCAISGRSARGAGPRARGRQKLIVGPWIHGWPPTGDDRIGGMSFPGVRTSTISPSASAGSTTT